MSIAVSQGGGAALLAAPSIATNTATEQSTSECKQGDYEEAGETCGDDSGSSDQQSWASKMNGMMKELYESQKEAMHSDAMEAECLPNGNESEAVYPPRPLSPPSGISVSNGNGVVADDCVRDLSSPLARHHRLSMMHGDALSQETSKLLREILQNKEKRLQQQFANGAVPPGLLEGVPSDRSFYGKFICREGDIYGNGDSEVDNASVHSGTPADCMSTASEDSDQENNGSNIVNGVSQKSAIKYTGINNNNSSKSPHSPAELDNQNEDSNNTSNTETGGEDSVQAKRARVENIITNMRLSPRAPLDLASGVLQEARRQKRKQYQPQQMENSPEEHTAPKQRKMEKDILRSQLKHMQQQLLHMQQRYMSLYECGSASDRLDGEGKEVCDNNNVLGSINKHMQDSKTLDSEKSPLTKLGLENGNTGQSNNDVCSLSYNKHENSDKRTVSRHSKVPMDADGLAKVLKEEIASSIGGLVDSVVAKLMSPKKKEEKLPIVPLREPKEEKNKPNSQKENKDTKDSKDVNMHKSIRTKVSDKILPMESPHKLFHDIHRPHPNIYAPPIYPPAYFPTQVHPPPPLFPTQPEQKEALSLVVPTPKRKRTKVTDTRLSPRAARALLQETPPHQHHPSDVEKHHVHPAPEHYHHGLVPVSLPTSVAIPNPSLQHSDVLAMYTHGDRHGPYGETLRSTHSPSTGDHISPSMAHMPMDSMSMPMFKSEQDSYENSLDSPTYDGSTLPMTSTLTPMHLRKAKLMFFFLRYPSSAILKIYFPDIKFNKNNTAQLVKWFSNFREFYYIQMEKYARQAIAEGIKNPEELIVTLDSELYRILNLHYNRNNQIEVPDNFRVVVQSSLREFFKSINAGKDQEQSWKKSIYKVIARMDDSLPEFFKHPNWMEQLSDV